MQRCESVWLYDVVNIWNILIQFCLQIFPISNGSIEEKCLKMKPRDMMMILQQFQSIKNPIPINDIGADNMIVIYWF